MNGWAGVDALPHETEGVQPRKIRPRHQRKVELRTQTILLTFSLLLFGSLQISWSKCRVRREWLARIRGLSQSLLFNGSRGQERERERVEVKYAASYGWVGSNGLYVDQDEAVIVQQK